MGWDGAAHVTAHNKGVGGFWGQTAVQSWELLEGQGLEIKGYPDGS